MVTLAPAAAAAPERGKPIKPGRHRHRRAPHLRRSVAVLSLSSLTTWSPCQNYPFGKGAQLPPRPQNGSGVSRLNFFQAISWHKSQTGLILAGGRGGAARPQLSPEQDTPYPSITGAERGCSAPVSPPSHFWGAAAPVCIWGGFSHRCWEGLRGSEPTRCGAAKPKNPVSCPALPTPVTGSD